MNQEESNESHLYACLPTVRNSRPLHASGAGMIGIGSRGILRIPHLAALLGRPVQQLRLPGWLPASGLSAVAGWGQRQSTASIRRFAIRRQLPFIALEDGFLRSCGLGVDGAPPLSLVIDDLGIYYDATGPSRLETLIATLAPNEALQRQACEALALIRRHRLSKYNHAPERQLPPLAPGRVGRVLVIDQTMGDVSVQLGGADTASFTRMLAAALAEHPNAEIWVKTHPDVLTGKKQGYLDAAQLALCSQSRLHLLAEDVSPLHLIEQVDTVYAVTSQMGFEALMLGKSVVCFGLPWYAGWGLTDDRHPGIGALGVRRPLPLTVEQLFEAAYLHYARYIDPASGAPGTLFDVIDWLARNKAANDAARGTLYCIGMSLWKRAVVAPFLAGPSCKVHFVRSAAALARRTLAPDARIVIWGVRDEARVVKLAAARAVPVWRMEDGFLRSVGLGSDLFRPVSLVLDRSGMYYDPASGSELEQLIGRGAPDSAELARAARFRDDYVSLRMSKYNLARTPLDVKARGRRVLLVPGQVEDDASIARGATGICTNLALLQAVRAANPNACILYKAHPDVVAGNRRGAIAADALAALADACVNDANIIDCIRAADELHTMTSLSGFEALLHGCTVHCYGAPFYAGWGLTVDHVALPQRQAIVSVDALVAAVMLAYPRYVLPGVAGFVAAETVMAHLLAQAGQGALLGGWRARKLRKLGALAQLLRAAWAVR